MTQPRISITLLSRAGHPKPVSPAQVEALKTIALGDVFMRGDRVYGIRNDVYEVLERNELVEVLDVAQDPDRNPRWRRFGVQLTARGGQLLEAVGS